MRTFSRIIVVLIALVSSVALTAGDAHATPRVAKKRPYTEDQGFLGLGAGYIYGDSTYRINLSDPATGAAIESELKFPIQTLLFTLEAGYIGKDSKNRDAIRIHASYSFDVGSASGKFEDSDWLNDVVDTALVGAPHPGKDIYSESDVDLNARVFDIRASYSFWASDGFGIGPLGGYLSQTFDFTARDLNQVGYGPYAADYTGSVPGTVLTYNVKYSIPYLGIHTEAGHGFRMLLDLAYSPWAEARDEDDHVLRTKIATAKTSGDAYLAMLGLQMEMEDNNSIVVRGDYLRIDTKGTQNQYWYGNTTGEPPAGTVIADIPDKITSEQLSFSLFFTHRF